MMATILQFSLAGRRIRTDRPRPGTTATIVPYPGVRYERLDEGNGHAPAGGVGAAKAKPAAKAGMKTDF